MISARSNSSGDNKKREVLNIVSPLQIMYYYIKLPFNTLISSPFRDDKNPSFIYGDKYGGGFKDFAKDEHSGDWVNLVQLYYAHKGVTLSYNQAIAKVIEDLKLDLKKPISKEESKLLLGLNSKKTEKIIKVRTREWDSKYLKYWFDYGISLYTLKLYQVYPISHYWVNGVRYVCAMSYVYIINNKPKILNTTKKREHKWITNIVKTNVLEGYYQLPKEGDLLIITKSLKDVMVLHELGFNAVSPIRENVTIDDSTLKLLSIRFKKVIFFLDNDNVGFKKMEEYYKKGYPYIFIPFSQKDISDLVQAKGILTAKKILLWLINKEQ